MLDFRVNTFLTVCELGNYTKTAEKLGLTQPAVTQHIRFIEDRYKVKLLLKDGKSMKLTEAGEALRDMFITLQADEKKIGRRLSELNQKPGPLVMPSNRRSVRVICLTICRFLCVPRSRCANLKTVLLRWV